MTTVEELKDFFENGFGADTGIIKSLEFDSPDNFTADLRCKISEEHGQLTMEDYKEFIKTFIQKFSELTMTSWLFRKSYPAVSYRLYRKIYVCHQASFRKGKFNPSKNVNCEAKINASIKVLNENTVGDLLLQDGYNIIININNQHSHVIHEHAVNKCDAALDAKLIEYFDNGMTPAIARRLYQTKVMEEHEDDVMQALTNPQINPTDRHIQYLYTKWRDGRAERVSKNYEQILEEMKKNYPDHTISYKRDSVFVVMLTPVMKRMYKSSENNIVFIDNSSPGYQKGTCVTFLYTYTKIGAVPIASVLHTEQNEHSYTLLFRGVKEVLEEINPNVKFQPNIIYTNDVKSQRKALGKIFQGSHLLLCSYQLCQALWRLVCDLKHRIDSEKRQTIMLEFRKLIAANDVITAQNIYEELIKDKSLCSSTAQPVLEHLIALWKRRSEWVLAHYRNDHLPLSYNPNNLSETSIRIFKDILMQRCRAFNMVPLGEFVCSTLENYHRKRILAYTKRQNVPYDYTRLLSVGEDITNIYKINNNEFKVESDLRQDSYYTARLDIGFCDCIHGKSGAFCKHLCYIEDKYGVSFKNNCDLTDSDRLSYAKIALGDEVDTDVLVDNTPEVIIKIEPEFDDDMETENFEEQSSITLKQDATSPHRDTSQSEACDLRVLTPAVIYTPPNPESSAPSLSQEFNRQNAATCSMLANRPLRPPIESNETMDLDEYDNSLVELNKEFRRLSNLFKDNPTIFNMKAVHKLTNRLKGINTPAEAQKFIFHDVKFSGVKSFKFTFSRRLPKRVISKKSKSRNQTRQDAKK